MFPEAKPRVNMDFLDSSASNLKGEGGSQLFVSLKQGLIVILSAEGSKVWDRASLDSSVYC